MLVMSWSYPVDDDNLVLGLGGLGHGPSRLDLGSSDLDQVQVDDWDLLLLTVFEMATMVLPQGTGHPLVGRHSHLAHLWVSGKDQRGGRVHIMDMKVFLDMMTMELEMARGTLS